MIIPRYTIDVSRIPNAGRGVILAEAVRRAAVIVAPTDVRAVNVLRRAMLERLPHDSIERRTSLRWFEDFYTIDPDWSDECYINHSFEPTGLWHLGFVFALRDLEAGEEVTIDYRLLAEEDERLDFDDALTGRSIVGMSWRDNVLHTTRALQALMLGGEMERRCA
ncbi:MAG TPA: SET domain-containing protein [Gammaproteobacteria bacterium]|nr:SET domain-containing protein [Gammaproteobacteria bacterium]